MNTVFETHASVTGGRDGVIKSDNGVLDLEVRMPKTLGGKGGDYTNPEQLFAAGYAACFDSALNLVARMAKTKIQSETTATVGLMANEAGEFAISVKLDIEVNGVEQTLAQELVEKAHQVCPYSKAIKNNVHVQINLK